MIAVTCMALGLAAGMTRSVVSVAMVGLMIAATFLAASLVGLHAASLMALGLAILGYNLGLIGLLAGGVLISGSRTAAAH
nr:hypothetical protein [uncultured Gellertiella sp.]